MSGRAAIAAMCVLVSLATPSVAGLRDATIENLSAELAPAEAFVSFGIEGAVDDEVIERLHAGLAVRFEHNVDLILKRSALLPSKVLARAQVKTRVEYDSLTRQYRLFRSLRNKTKRRSRSLLDYDVSRNTPSLHEAVDWLTRVEEVPLPLWPEIRDSERLRVRVSSDLGRRFILFVIPSSHSASAELRLEF